MPAFDLSPHFRTHRVLFLLDGLPEAAFREAYGLEVKEAAHGGRFVLAEGVTDADSLWRWCKRCLDEPHLASVRRDGEVALIDGDGRTVRRWRFRVGICVGFLGPQVEPQGETVAVHGLAIEHEGLEESLR